MTGLRPWPHLYQLLGVHVEASREEIQEAFLARFQEAAEDPHRRSALTEAWDVLGSAQARAAYDRRPAHLPNRELAGAVRALVIALACGLGGCLFFVFIGARDVSIVGAGVLAACAPTGWQVVERPLRWLELDRIKGAGLLRVVTAMVAGPFVAPVAIGGPLLRWFLVMGPVLAIRLRERCAAGQHRTSRARR